MSNIDDLTPEEVERLADLGDEISASLVKNIIEKGKMNHHIYMLTSLIVTRAPLLIASMIEDQASTQSAREFLENIFMVSNKFRSFVLQELAKDSSLTIHQLIDTFGDK